MTAMASSPEKKVLIRVETWPSSTDSDSDSITGANGAYEWYVIDNNADDSEQVQVFTWKTDDENVETIHPVFKSPSGSSDYRCGFASWNSYVYVFGGCNEETNFTPVSNTYYIDTRCPQDGWKPCPSLENARQSLYGVVFKGRILALGGCPHLPIYGESLLPLVPSTTNNDNNRWLPLPMARPNQLTAPGVIHGHAIYGEKLFVYGTGAPGLRSYDFNTNSWTVIEDNFGRWDFQCAAIDQVMYLVEGGKFMAFDLVKRQWYTVVGLEEDSMLPRFSNDRSGFGFTSSLVHLGNGTLCLLWNCVLSADYSAIFCTKFTVSKEDDDDDDDSCSIIKATVKSFKIFRLLNGGDLAGSLAIDHAKAEDEVEEYVKDQGKGVIIAKKAEEEEGSAKGVGELPKKKKQKTTEKGNKRWSLAKKVPCKWSAVDQSLRFKLMGKSLIMAKREGKWFVVYDGELPKKKNKKGKKKTILQINEWPPIDQCLKVELPGNSVIMAKKEEEGCVIYDEELPKKKQNMKNEKNRNHQNMVN